MTSDTVGGPAVSVGRDVANIVGIEAKMAST